MRYRLLLKDSDDWWVEGEYDESVIADVAAEYRQSGYDEDEISTEEAR